MLPRELVYTIDAKALPAVLARVRAAFPARAVRARSETSLYLDTFDRRIQRAGGSLRSIARGRELELHWQREGSDLRSRCRELPAFAQDLPGGRMRDELTGLVAPRRLLPLVECERRVHELDLLDGEHKTVARLGAIERQARAAGSGAPGSPLAPLLVARPVRGYAAPFERLAALLGGEPGLHPHGETGTETEMEMEEALEASGLPRAPGERVPVRLSPSAPAGAAVRSAMLGELEVMLAQEDGLRRDVDTEFLHDWRVALRRARCGLRQMRRFLPAAEVERFSVELRWLSQASGPLRDLDILADGLAQVEEGSGLSELVAWVREERAKEHARFLATLDGAECRAFLLAWRGFLEDERRTADPRCASEPVLAAVSRRLRKRRRKLLERGRKVATDSPPAKIHRLRIECKKLRYLLDLFSSLYPAPEIEAVNAAIKRFQTTLGESNDASVQVHLLGELAGRMHARGRASAEGLLAVGRLQATLHERRRRATRKFIERFRSFRHDRELFRFLVDGPRES